MKYTSGVTKPMLAWRVYLVQYQDRTCRLFALDTLDPPREWVKGWHLDNILKELDKL